MSVIIGALSGLGELERRRRCRETWFRTVRKLGHRPYFLLAKGEIPDYDPLDCLHLDCPEGYQFLPQRTRAFMVWAVEQPNVDLIFKCDDDTFLHPQRFDQFIQTLPGDVRYVGAEWRPGVGYGSGGAGYLVRDARLIADNLTMPIGPEDLLVGQLLRGHGIAFTIDRRFVPFSETARPGWPLKSNDLISGHKMSDRHWDEAWRDL